MKEEKVTSLQQSELQEAHRRIDSFSQRFGNPHFWFACHAAFALAVTPDLLYCLWANFQQDINEQPLDIPWIAVADLLFSELLSEVGYEIYQMDRVVRKILLQRLQEEQNFGQDRITELAQFLLAYVEPQLESDDPDERDFALTQLWTALAYLQPTTAVRQLAAFYQVSLNSGTELVRMESLVENFTEPLAEFSPLFTYARSLGNFARGDIVTATNQLKEVPKKGNLIEIAGTSLLIPQPIQTPRRWTRRRFLQIAGYTALAGGGLIAALFLPQLAERWISKPDLLPAPDQMTLTPFNFEVLTVNARGEVINRVTEESEFFTHNLGNGVNLEMVAIPGGTFLMGTEDAEIERLVQKFNWEAFRSEKPQHEVTVQPFFMSKFLVTQAQWRAIAALPKIERDLSPNRSRFRGDDLPVETISWNEAVEFCQRLSSLIAGEYEYRLPSEAEWEYAARAGTITPFHYGETITGELANYGASETFADEAPGEYRRETTPVGSFPPNAFGLYDMHGNVWEWCEDDSHDSYNGAPTDGSAWLSENSNIKVLRGGSWGFDPILCRSACRLNFARVDRYYIIGFRVVCVAARTT
ncbi:MAG: formylglycine-generating enzyme family protein [Xenococcaceae cyanobacterium MO_207.B15]|nr:formylglycine-generating enzyme family protein [Xenococcaceae cyanobacterium MO_207.B15]